MKRLSASFIMPTQEVIKMKFEGTLENYLYTFFARQLIKELIDSKAIQIKQDDINLSHRPGIPQTSFRASLLVENL